MDAVILAGGKPQPDDPLYPMTQGLPKSMAEICGKPMLQWVLDAIEKADTIQQVVIVGLTPEQNLTSTKIREYVPDQGSILLNIRAGVRQVQKSSPQANQVALISADIPAILPEHINWVVKTASQYDLDLCYTVIKQEVMEQRFPSSRRTYTHLKDCNVCGGDLNVVRASAVLREDTVWDQLVANRKNPIKQAAIIGFGTVLRLLLGQITLARVVEKVTRRIGLTGQALVCPFAEIGMDVDKLFQLELMRTDLCK